MVFAAGAGDDAAPVTDFLVHSIIMDPLLGALPVVTEAPFVRLGRRCRIKVVPPLGRPSPMDAA